MDKRIDCKKTRELLSFYLDEELSVEEQALVSQHLETCVACGTEYEELKRIRILLSEAEELPLPASFDRQLSEAIRMENEKTAATAGEFPDAYRSNQKKNVLWKKISSIAAVFVIGIFGIVLYNNMDSIIPNDNSRAEPLSFHSSNQEENNSHIGEEPPQVSTDGALQDEQSGGIAKDEAEERDDPAKKLSQPAAEAPAEEVPGFVYNFRSGGGTPQPATTAGAAENLDEGAAAAGVTEEGIQTETTPQRHLDQIGTGEAITTEKWGELPVTIGGITDARDLQTVKYYIGLLEEELNKVPFESEIVNSYQEEGLWYFEIEIYAADEYGNPAVETYTYVGQDGTLWRND